jgi:hypothetical protein
MFSADSTGVDVHRWATQLEGAVVRARRAHHYNSPSRIRKPESTPDHCHRQPSQRLGGCPGCAHKENRILRLDERISFASIPVMCVFVTNNRCRPQQPHSPVTLSSKEIRCEGIDLGVPGLMEGFLSRALTDTPSGIQRASLRVPGNHAKTVLGKGRWENDHGA